MVVPLAEELLYPLAAQRRLCLELSRYVSMWFPNELVLMRISVPLAV